jgi:hypothetical protein
LIGPKFWHFRADSLNFYENITAGIVNLKYGEFDDDWSIKVVIFRSEACGAFLKFEHFGTISD